MREGTRTAFIVVLLVATLLLTAFMAVRAQRAATYHRVTAEKVVRDWTRVAAEELARRTDAQAGFYGTYPVLQSMASGAEVNSELVRCRFRFDGSLVSDCPASVQTWLLPQLRSLAANPPKPMDRTPLHMGQHTFVYIVANDEIHGFEVERAQLAPSFANVIDMRPLLPQSLKIGNEALRFRVLDGGRPIFATTSYRERAPLTVSLPIDEGLLRGMTIEASIAPEAAPLLVFGGIPRELPIYMVTLGITSLLLLTALLQLRKERALARLRSDFVASVSHELRTPLTQIRMFAETLLLERVRSDEERRRALTVIDQETRRLAQLVENVLHFSRGQRGTLRIQRRSIDLNALVRETVDSFRPIAAARNVSIRTSFPPAATVEGDADAISQIVLNLLDNAVKYGPPGQEVQVTVESAGVARIIVDDEGPGVPPLDRNRIWRRYERLSRDAGRAVAGAGIGLAVVRELVSLHHGTARVETSPRGGARFVVELPP